MRSMELCSRVANFGKDAIIIYLYMYIFMGIYPYSLSFIKTKYMFVPPFLFLPTHVYELPQR